MLSGACFEAEENNYFIKLSQYQYSGFRNNLDKVIEQRPAGIITSTMHDNEYKYFQEITSKYKIPTAIVDNNSPHISTVSVYSDDNKGGFMATEHLIKLGHRKIGHATLDRPSKFVKARRQGFSNAMKKYGIRPNANYMIENSFKNEHSDFVKDFEGILCGKNRPTAFFCSTDHIALMALRAAFCSGLRVPEDLAVVGYGDLYMSRFVTPALTTIHKPFIEMGRRTVKYLLKKIMDSKDHNIYNNKLEVELIVRNSTGPLVGKE